jgi:hypothetical protein
MRVPRVGRGTVLPGLVAFLLAPALVAAPPLAQPVAAADELREVAAATYVVDPATAAVHVSVNETVTNLKPNVTSGGVVRQYFYDEILVPIHSEATKLAATDARGALRITRKKEDGYDLVTVRLRRSIFYRQAATVTLRYDLPGGAPRSEGEIRIGQAYVGLYVFAWGDPGRGAVRVELPKGFVPEVVGDDLEQTTSGDTVVLSATAIAQPYEFFAVISADREARLAVSRITLGDGDTIAIRAWPEDAEWQARVGDTLRDGTPLLRKLIGLDWPVSGELVVTEVQAAALEGYAGIYDTFNDTILITENLDELTIVHEASHAWFNDRLFDSRWIDEGLADTYASVVLGRLDLGDGLKPTSPLAGDEGAVALNTWTFPGRIDDDATAAREDYGYNAAWYLVTQLYDEVGEDGMRAVLRAAENDQIAYLGDGPPELVAKRDDWRRFLDLLEERAGSKRADGLFRRLVLTTSEGKTLDERADAREAYDALEAAGADLAPPPLLRKAMSSWKFSAATDAIAEAHSILDDRAALRRDAATLAVELPDDVERAWRAADGDFAASHEAVSNLQAALTDLAGARDALDAERDFVVTVGLLGVDPELGWQAAVAAFEADDLAAADTATDEITAQLAKAPGDGQTRIAGAGLAVGIFAIGGVAIARRGRRRRSAAFAPAMAPAAAVAGEPSATLPAEPDAASPEPSFEAPPVPAPTASEEPDARRDPTLEA